MTIGNIRRYTSLDSAIKEIWGADRTVERRSRVSGGDINEAYALTLNDGTVLFMKTNTVSAISFFEAEEAGLEAIRATGTIGVPEVLGLGTDSGFSFLLMEYISGRPQIRDFWETFAAELAAMHNADAGEYFGFTSDNWIGAGRQINTPHKEWITFFRECRLRPQFQAARDYFSSEDRKRINSLLSKLDRYLIEPAKPSLLHGDLWAGNMITGNDGKGWLIDPAVYYGHPEADIAMTQLFGGYSHRFYAAYRQFTDMEPGYEDRRDLYNLYHLLNHLNLFGSGYLGSVQRILRRYG